MKLTSDMQRVVREQRSGFVEIDELTQSVAGWGRW